MRQVTRAVALCLLVASCALPEGIRAQGDIDRIKGETRARCGFMPTTEMVAHMPSAADICDFVLPGVR